jgi:hypothetical protein
MESNQTNTLLALAIIGVVGFYLWKQGVFKPKAQDGNGNGNGTQDEEEIPRRPPKRNPTGVKEVINEDGTLTTTPKDGTLTPIDIGGGNPNTPLDPIDPSTGLLTQIDPIVINPKVEAQEEIGGSGTSGGGFVVTTPPSDPFINPDTTPVVRNPNGGSSSVGGGTSSGVRTPVRELTFDGSGTFFKSEKQPIWK